MSDENQEVAMAECGSCRAIVPVDSTECPECGVSFSGVSDEALGECGNCNSLNLPPSGGSRVGEPGLGSIKQRIPITAAFDSFASCICRYISHPGTSAAAQLDGPRGGPE